MAWISDRILWGLTGYYFLTGIYIAAVPEDFYSTAPGVVDTGPYNMHFIRDVGFAFIVSALGMAYGLKQSLKPLLVFGASWLVVHGLFHLILWLGHAAHFSTLALIDLAVVVAPALLLAALVVNYKGLSDD